MKRIRICQLLLWMLLLLITGCRQIAAQVEELQQTSPAEQRKVILPQASYTFTDRPTVELPDTIYRVSAVPQWLEFAVENDHQTPYVSSPVTLLTDDNGDVWVNFIVTNPNPSCTFDDITVNTMLLDERGNMIEDSSDYLFSNLLPGGTFPMTMRFYDDNAASYANVAFELEVDPDDCAKADFSGEEITFSDEYYDFDHQTLSALATGAPGEQVYDARIAAAGYDAEGRLVAVSRYVEYRDVMPGDATGVHFMLTPHKEPLKRFAYFVLLNNIDNNMKDHSGRLEFTTLNGNLVHGWSNRVLFYATARNLLHDRALTNLSFQTTLFDADGNVLDTDWLYFTTALPGEDFPIIGDAYIGMDDLLARADHYEIEFTYAWEDDDEELPRSNPLAVISTQLEITGEERNQDAVVTATIRNSHAMAVIDAELLAVLLDENGHPIVFDTLDDIKITAKGETTVELIFSLDDDDPPPASVDVYAYWSTWTELRESE